MIPMIFSIILTLISALGLFLNGYIFVIIILTKQIATANNLLVLHLGGVGTLLCLVPLFSWLPGAPCALSGFLTSLLHPVVLWTVCGLNCDRYCAISAPLHYGALVNHRKVILGLAATWILALVLSAPPLLGAAPYRPASIGVPFPCAPDWSAPESLPYCLVYTVFTLILPATVMVVCNIKILMIARYHKHRIASAIYEVTLSAQVTITHQRNPFFVPTVTSPNAPRIRNKSAYSNVLQLVGSVFLFYFPYYIAILWQSIISFITNETKLSVLRPDPHLIVVATTLLFCSPPVNGIFYGLKSKVLRKTFQNYWRKKMMKNEINQEIQARTPSTCGSRRPSITPLSMMNKPCLQRRLSEALIDMAKSSPNKNNKIKRIASDQAWKGSINFGVFDNPITVQKPERPIGLTSSCNTLQVPTIEGENSVPLITKDETYITFKSSFKSHDHQNPRTSGLPLPRPAMSTTNLILQRVFGLESQNDILTTRKMRGRGLATTASARRSPRILITRAFSEESEKSPSLPGSPNREAISKKYSCSTTTLLERKWKVLRYQDEQIISESHRINATNGKENRVGKSVAVCYNDASAESSDASSCGEEEFRKYVSLDERIGSPVVGSAENVAPEEQLLLSWPTAKRKLQRTKPNGIINHSARPSNGRIIADVNQ